MNILDQLFGGGAEQWFSAFQLGQQQQSAQYNTALAAQSLNAMTNLSPACYAPPVSAEQMRHDETKRRLNEAKYRWRARFERDPLADCEAH